MVKKISIYFTAGCFGGIINSLSVWLFGLAGVTAMFGVSIHPTLSAPWLYPRIIWGGIWGILFFIPKLHKMNVLLAALIASMGPTIIQLFIVFPFKANKGMMGLEIGGVTPFFVILFNFIWGYAALQLIRKSQK